MERVFVSAGFSTLRFNFRGASSSTGFSGVSGAVTDAISAIDFLASQTNVKTPALVGYSFGASVALRSALLRPPKFLITLSASKDLVVEDGFEIQKLIEIESPTMMYHGTSDQMIPCDDVDELSEAIRLDPINLVKLEGEGHFYQFAMEKVIESVREFLRDLRLLED
jgi:alpha/beta superfamily hydrolase